MIKDKLIYILILFAACKNQPTEIRNALASMPEQKFIGKQYVKSTPVAQILNPGNFFTQNVEFEMTKLSTVKIFGVGEILYDMKDEDHKYYLANDRVELYFANQGRSSLIKKISYKTFSIDLKSHAASNENGISCQWSITKNLGGSATITIPLRLIPLNEDIKQRSVLFNIAIGDNDDGFVQESKLGWCGHNDKKIKFINDFGELLLKKKTVLDQARRQLRLNYVKLYPTDTARQEYFWKSQPLSKISNILYGTVKDKYDLSGSFKACFDDSNLYIKVDLLDSRQKVITKAKLAERQLFTDYGWLEDAKGKKIWEMNVLHSRYAGGVYRNQKVDTTLRLPAGKYHLKYVTDEAHSFNNWIGQGPSTPFYGIVIYQAENRSTD